MFYSKYIFYSILILWLGCENPSDNDNQTRSFRQINSFPLYEMVYQGDYGFESLLETGIAASVYCGKKNWACTCLSTISADSSYIMGRNFDWYEHPALILFTNPSNGYASVSMVDLYYIGININDSVDPDDERLNLAPLFPFDGMNEYGLAVGIMAVPYAHPPSHAHRVTLGSLHVVRLILDYAKNVSEAIDLMEQYNIDFQGGPALHYYIADRTGSSAVIEFVDQQMIVLRNDNPWQVSTNFILCLTELEGATSGCWRYNLAYKTLEDHYGQLTNAGIMETLSSVSQANTRWSVTYDLTCGEINLVVGRNYEQVYTWDLN